MLDVEDSKWRITQPVLEMPKIAGESTPGNTHHNTRARRSISLHVPDSDKLKYQTTKADSPPNSNKVAMKIFWAASTLHTFIIH